MVRRPRLTMNFATEAQKHRIIHFKLNYKKIQIWHFFILVLFNYNRPETFRIVQSSMQIYCTRVRRQ